MTQNRSDEFPFDHDEAIDEVESRSTWPIRSKALGPAALVTRESCLRSPSQIGNYRRRHLCGHSYYTILGWNQDPLRHPFVPDVFSKCCLAFSFISLWLRYLCSLFTKPSKLNSVSSIKPARTEEKGSLCLIRYPTVNSDAVCWWWNPPARRSRTRMPRNFSHEARVSRSASRTSARTGYWPGEERGGPAREGARPLRLGPLVLQKGTLLEGP